jgi:tetratricopeptide (TPR) repeat protein
VLQFQHIEYLVALAAIPLMIFLYLLLIKWKKNTVRKIGDPLLVKQLVQDYSPSKFTLKFILFIVGFAVAVIGLANPRLPQGSTKVNRTGIDVMIALDVSKSMLAQDIKPDRLERAKQVLAKLIDRLQDDRIGIVVFAGRAYLQMPLTTDHGAAKMYLSSVSPEAVPTQGTVIGDALKMSAAAFNSKEKKYKSIVLISDGEDHDENALTYAKSLAAEGVMINTIGIGSPEGAMIMDPETNDYKKDKNGIPVITKLNDAELKSIAENANGIYQDFTNSDEVVTNIEAHLKTMGQRPITENSLINYRNLFPWFLALALLALIGEFFLSEIKKVRHRSVPVKKSSVNPLSLGCLLLLSPFLCFAQNDNKLVKKGNEAYAKQLYDAAVDDYKKAIEKNPANLPAQYNLGNALYKSQKIDDAIAAYDAAIQQSKAPLDKSGAFYNKGVVLQNNKKLPECIEAYKDALRLNPADEDARLNLQKALLEQKQQQQQNENKEKKKPKNDPKEKEKQKQQEDKEKNEPPKPQPSKMTKREAEEKLKALLQQEKKLQDKLRKVNAASPVKPDKDW